LATYRQLGDRRSTAFGLHDLGRLHRHQGAPDAAAACYTEALTLLRDLRDRRGIVSSLRHLAHVARAQGRAERALRLAGAFEAQRHRTGAGSWSTRDRADTERMVAAARQRLGEAPAAAARAARRAMTLEQAVADALEEAPAPSAGPT
jgi:hypothetical protein